MRLFRTFVPVTCAFLLAACDSAQDPTASPGTSLRGAVQAAQGLKRDFMAVDLGTLGGPYSHSVAINNAGQVAGNSWTASGKWHAFLWDKGVLTDLGTLGDESYAIAMNSRGQVIGHNLSGSDWRAFIWSRGVMTDLGTLGGGTSQASAINDAGQVVGYSSVSSGEGHGFIWEKGVMTDLGTLGGTGCLPLAINNAGQVVGSSETAAGLTHAFLWERGVMTDLGTLRAEWSQAVAINNQGQVVGNSGSAFLWDRGVITDLGTLGGTSSTVLPGDVIPGAINDRGQAAGVSKTTTGEFHAFLWDRGVMTDLGKLGGMQSSVGWVINNAGEMIGTQEYVAQNCAVDHVFYWAKGVMTDLPTLNGVGSECPTNWPAGINNAGQVAGASDGHAVLWQPAPSMKSGR